MTHVKLFRRDEVSESGDKYLMVISEMSEGEWVPNRVQTAQTFVGLKEALRQIADAGVVVVRGSRQFERLAFELGLQHLKSEWSKP